MLGSVEFPESAAPATDRPVLLAIDDAMFPVRQHTGIYITKPTVRGEPVLTPSDSEAAPDSAATHFYGTVLHDDRSPGKPFRMWYYACHRGKNPDWPADTAAELARYTSKLFMGPLCYAESDDGITWHKPALEQVMFKGSAANNALALPHALVANPAVLRDDSDPDPARRYKMVYEFWRDGIDPTQGGNPDAGKPPTMRTAVSADGITWTAIGKPLPDDFIEHSSFFRHNNRFIVHAQSMGPFVSSEGGGRAARVGVAFQSYDFDRWIDGFAPAFTLPEPVDPAQRGVSGTGDQVHLGVGAVSLGNVCVGVYGKWHNADYNESFADISCDLSLVVSSDGIAFREVAPGHVWLHAHESPATPARAPGWNRDYHTNLCQANGILNLGDETRIYHGRWRNVGADHLEDYCAEVALATLPRDRWGAIGLDPGHHEGWVYTTPLRITGGFDLRLNADSAHGIHVDICDEKFRPIDGASGKRGGVGMPTANGLDCVVQWPGKSLDDCAGPPVRLRFTLSRSATSPDGPRLYAAYLRR